jgi:hypothetical protein
MFENEFVVRINTVTPNGTQVASTLVSRDCVRVAENPSKGRSVKGTLRAYCMERKNKLVAVILPQATFENGPSVVVPETEVVPG